MITHTPLTAALGVNAQVKCDCSEVRFEVAIAATESGNNFLRALECISCHKQMTLVHRSDSGLAPALV